MTETETEGAFRLTFVQGHGLLSLAGRDFEGLGRVDSLELEIPNLRFPFDMSGGVALFKNRRLRLRELALAVGSDDLTGFLARAPLGDFGIFDPRVTVDGSRLTLTARVRLGGREVELTAAAVLSPLPPRSASLCVYDVRAFGFLPVPAPLVVNALLLRAGRRDPGQPGKRARDRPAAARAHSQRRRHSHRRLRAGDVGHAAHVRLAHAGPVASPDPRRGRRRQVEPRALGLLARRRRGGERSAARR